MGSEKHLAELPCALQVPWYAVLGNHDYGDGIESDRLKHCQLDGSDVLIVQWMRECSIPIGRTPNGSACCFSPLWQVWLPIQQSQGHKRAC